MSDRTQTSSIAVVCGRDSEHAAAVAGLLESLGVSQAGWHLPRAVDDVDRAVRDGHVREVVFARRADLLDAVWSRRIAFDQWRAAGVRVQLADQPEQGAIESLIPVIDSWYRWQRSQRRRQWLAGVLLSLAALVAAFCLLLLA